MRLAVVVLSLLIVAIVVACTGGKSVDSLSVGDCFDDPSSYDTEIEEVDAVDCGDPHDNEVYAVVHHPEGSGAAYPGRGFLERYADGLCYAEFEAYVGRDYGTSRLDYSYFYPVRDGWEAGDREVLCFLYDYDLAKLSGSMKGSGE